MQVAGQVVYREYCNFTCPHEAFRNAFVNLIAFLFLLNQANKSDKKYPEIGCLLDKEQDILEIESKQ